MKFTKILLLFFLVPIAGIAQSTLFERGKSTTIYIDKNEKEVVFTALELLRRDVKTVVGAELVPVDKASKAQLVVQTSRELKGKWENFSLNMQGEKLVISGSDARGKAYGLLELSRMLGVSPWHYYADVKPQTLDEFRFNSPVAARTPSVKYRGIFLNDEDWGLMPWATQTLSPHSAKGAIGPEAYEKIFELMLRLRANTIWPAMHECTVPFYFVEGNRQMADKYGIVVGTSHCEPLMRNSAGEWDVAGKGAYNFVSNREHVVNYWSERLVELRQSENIFTIGMRGKHDGMMEGVKTLQEHKAALSEIIPAQRKLLQKYIHKRLDQVPQVFIPYKEVLDVYDNGLEVPEEVTLVWCDDNYGYIKRLSNEQERARSGGSGVYYHVSYWGRPHDYLWLATTSPTLVYTEMKRAYDHGADRLWILNVGDLKPAEYLTEHFLDMAWDIESARPGFSHLQGWMEREFGAALSNEITQLKKEYYRLAAIRKPEFMGWSRVEESGYGRGGRTPVRDTEYNPAFGNELQHRLKVYEQLSARVDELSVQVPERLQSAYFQLVEYPVKGASLMNQKWLYAQLARQWALAGSEMRARGAAVKSEMAYLEIEKLTGIYNRLEQGKWNRLMDFNPRTLPVFAAPDFSKLDSLIAAGKKRLQVQENQAQKNTTQNNPALAMSALTNSAVSPGLLSTTARNVQAVNASQAVNIAEAGKVMEGLGHSFAAVQLPAGAELRYEMEVPEEGTYWIRIALVPNHGVDGKGMKIGVKVNDGAMQEISYKTEGRSEAWKQQVLRGQAVVTIPAVGLPRGKMVITIKALSTYVQPDQVMIGQGEVDFYEFPVR